MKEYQIQYSLNQRGDIWHNGGCVQIKHSSDAVRRYLYSFLRKNALVERVKAVDLINRSEMVLSRKVV